MCGTWGRGIEEGGGGGDSLEGDGKYLLGVWERGMEKKICTLCVILMEDG